MNPVIGIVALGVLGVLGILAWRYRGKLAYDLRLLNAKLVADRFYSTYAGITKNIAYGTTPRETLDVYQPADTGQHPVLIWVHGGSWISGHKELYAPVAQKVMAERIVVVIPNYTIALNAASNDHPLAFLQAAEIAQVLAWTRENISKYGGDPNRIVMGGQSAGAHLSALVLLDPEYLAALHHSPQEICGWYGIAGPYSIPAQLEYERNIHKNNGQLLFDVFGSQDNFLRGSPVTFVHPNLPPVLLIHGDADETVPLAVSYDLQNALEGVGAKSELKVYAGAGHAGLLFDALAEEKPKLVQDLLAFAKQCPPVR